MVPVFTAASMLFSFLWLLFFSFALPPGLDFHILKLFCYASSLPSYKIFGNVWQIVSFAFFGFLTFCSIFLRCFCFAFSSPVCHFIHLPPFSPNKLLRIIICYVVFRAFVY